MNQGNWNTALTLLERAEKVQEEGTLDILYFNLGVVYEHFGRIEEAIAVYQKVLQMNPDDAETRARIQILSK